MQEAMEVAEAWRDGKPLEVLDEDEKPLVDCWRYAQEASDLILEMVRVASAREADWEAHIQDLVLSKAQKCKGKMWIVIGKEPLMSAIEVKVPAAA
jgi:NTP pyrophosphatase (non-canonical NTP hydrolase)